MDDHIRRCAVVRVIDGDTVVLDVDLGFHIWARGLKFRLARLNAPEMTTPAGKLSFEWLRGCDVQWVNSVKLDKWGRWLAELYSSGRVNVNDQMVKEGFASPVSYGEESK